MADHMPPLTDDESAFEERSIAQVAGPGRKNNTLTLVVLGLIVGALLWWVWTSNQQDAALRVTTAQDKPFGTPRRNDAPVVPQPEPAPPVLPAPVDPFQNELHRLALQQAEEQRKLAEQRRRSPILIVNNQARAAGAARSAVPTAADAEDVAATNASDVSAAERFAARVGSAQVETVQADYLRSRSHMIAQGTLLRAVLETAVHSDLPGFIRATVAHDVYSFDGSRLLIPKASRLVGQYQSGLVRGQTRLFVIWTRLLRPDGASLLIGSPGTDVLGRAGVAGDLDTHFFKIFGASILLSIIDGAIDVAVAQARDAGEGATTFIQNDASLSRAAEIALENLIHISPTIHIDQGTAIQVFVAKDLDFRNVESH